jgi:hypothetical protein
VGSVACIVVELESIIRSSPMLMAGSHRVELARQVCHLFRLRFTFTL